MSETVREVVNRALAIIGEVAGSGVQTYSEDRVRNDVIRAFDLFFKKRFWHQFSKWFTVTLNGTTGIISEDVFERVRNFEDFLAVHRHGQQFPLPILKQDNNPNVLTGTTVLYWTSLDDGSPYYIRRKLQFYPVTATGQVDVYVRLYPLIPPQTDFDWEDRLNLDAAMLADCAAYFSLAQDDLNANAAESCRAMMEMRYRDVVAGIARHPIPFLYSTSVPMQWREIG
jgi:hypothetical protein